MIRTTKVAFDPEHIALNVKGTCIMIVKRKHYVFGLILIKQQQNCRETGLTPIPPQQYYVRLGLSHLGKNLLRVKNRE